RSDSQVAEIIFQLRGFDLVDKAIRKSTAKRIQPHSDIPDVPIAAAVLFFGGEQFLDDIRHEFFRLMHVQIFDVEAGSLPQVDAVRLEDIKRSFCVVPVCRREFKGAASFILAWSPKKIALGFCLSFEFIEIPLSFWLSVNLSKTAIHHPDRFTRS